MKGTTLRTFHIEGQGTKSWDIEAKKYLLQDGFFNFFDATERKIFSVGKESVWYIEVTPEAK